MKKAIVHIDGRNPKQDDLCPKCGALLNRDEHPDGLCAGPWQCSNCDWFEEVLLGNIEAEDLPF